MNKWIKVLSKGMPWNATCEYHNLTSHCPDHAPGFAIWTCDTTTGQFVPTQVLLIAWRDWKNKIYSKYRPTTNPKPSEQLVLNSQSHCSSQHWMYSLTKNKELNLFSLTGPSVYLHGWWTSLTGYCSLSSLGWYTSSLLSVPKKGKQLTAIQQLHWLAALVG